MRSGCCCSEEVVQPKLESSIGDDLHQGYVEAGVKAPDTLPADYPAGCIQHTMVHLYAELRLISIPSLHHMSPAD